jgi:translocation and assembly module TamB
MRDQEHPSSARKTGRAALAVGALGVTAVAALGAAWLLRVQLAGWALDRYFDERQVAATFEVESVGFNGVSLRTLDLGEGTQAASAQAVLRWRNGAPRLDAIVLRGVRAQGRWDENGLDLGVLDRLTPSPSGEPFSVPSIGVTIVDAIATLDTPFGLARARLDAEGRLRGTLNGQLTLSLDRPEGDDLFQSAVLRGDAQAFTVRFTPAEGAGPALSGMVTAPWSPQDVVADLTLTAPQFEGFGIEASGVQIAARFDGDVPVAGATEPFGMIEATGSVDRFAFAGMRLEGARLGVISPASTTGAEAPFTLSAQEFSAPGASGGTMDVRGTARWASTGAVTVQGDAAFAGVNLVRDVRQQLERAWVNATGTPLEAISTAGRRATLGALADMRIAAPFVFAREGENLSLRLTGPLRMRGGNGLVTVFTPREAMVGLPGGAFVLAGEAQIGAARITGLRAEGVLGGAYVAQGQMAAAGWQAEGAALAHGPLALGLEGDGRALRLLVSGQTTLSGPIAGGRIEGLIVPLRMEVRQSAGGVRIAQAGGCMRLRFSALRLPTISFADGSVGFCPEGGVLAAISARGALSGRFSVDALALQGMQGETPAALRAARLEGEWGGEASAPSLSLVAAQAGYELQFDRPVGGRVEQISAVAQFSGADGLRLTGAFAGGRLEDPLAVVRVEDASGWWGAAPEGNGLAIAVGDGSAVISDAAPAGTSSEGYTPRFHALRVVGVEATLLGSSVQATGRVDAAAGGAMLGRFSARHDLALNAGDAGMTIDGLSFGPDLQPLDLTEFARGAVISMDGTVSGVLSARWAQGAFAANGQIDYAIADMAIAAVPDIRGVEGSIVFDDLLTFSTPPEQEVAIGVFNPGVALRNGAVRYQLLPGGVVAVEDARWQFAAGALRLDPTTINLTGGTAPLMLRLEAVDAQEAINALGIKDLTVVGQMEGVFPVALSASAAVITNGELRATGPGRLAYTGPIGDGMSSFADLAFDALSDFQYDDLALIINGDLAGDVDIDVRLSGLHAQDEMDLSPLFPLPGGARATADNVPFQFNIAIHAPFRKLVDTGAGIADPRILVRRAQRQNPATPPLDPPATRSP